MLDVVMVAVIVAFFALAVLLVRACDAIIGPDPVSPEVAVGGVPAEVAASNPEVLET